MANSSPLLPPIYRLPSAVAAAGEFEAALAMSGGEAAKTGAEKGMAVAKLAPCRAEKIFPFYARSRPSSPSSVLEAAGDPVWDAIRAEARLEVRIRSSLCFVFFCFYLGLLLF